MDYVVYYNLDAGLLTDTPGCSSTGTSPCWTASGAVDDGEIARAVVQLTPKWLKRSKFYGEYREDCDTVIVRVLRRMAEHYDTRCKRPWSSSILAALPSLR